MNLAELVFTIGMYFIVAALLTYTIAVWGEQITGHLKPIFVVMFCIGVSCDTIGTTIMALNMESGSVVLGPFDAAFHMITGLLAIGLMLIHAVWAIRVLLRDDEVSAARFHRFSKFVWLFWLVPFLSPILPQMIGGMT
jgi:uncharacterized repeat protein (TIGR03987 family)